MDWARLEIPGGGGLRDQGGGSAKRVFGFFSPNGAKSLIVTGDSPRREDIEIEEEFWRSECSVFFPPNGAKSLIVNRVRFNQCWSGI